MYTTFFQNVTFFNVLLLSTETKASTEPSV